MARPFSLTMQAHHLDLHRLWMALLLLSILLCLGGAAWILLDHVVVYEHSQSVQLGEGVVGDTTPEQRKNVGRVRTSRGQRITARFREAAFGKLNPGQGAFIVVRGDGPEQAIPAVIIEVRADCKSHQIQVVLRADFSEDGPNPFANAAPSQARVAVERFAPIALFNPGRAPQPTASPCKNANRDDSR